MYAEGRIESNQWKEKNQFTLDKSNNQQGVSHQNSWNARLLNLNCYTSILQHPAGNISMEQSKSLINDDKPPLSSMKAKPVQSSDAFLFHNVLWHRPTSTRQLTDAHKVDTRFRFAAFVVAAAACVAVTEAICLWLFALVPTSSTSTSSSRQSQGNRTSKDTHKHADTRTHTDFPSAVSLSSIHTVQTHKCLCRKHSELEIKQNRQGVGGRGGGQ